MSEPQPFRWAPFGPSLPDPPEPSSRPRASVPPHPEPAPALEARAPQTTAEGRNPARRVAILTCMDARIDPLAALGLRLGDAHVIRNAGATYSDDTIRSLRLSCDAAGTETVIVMAHSDCAAYGGDGEARRELEMTAQRVGRALNGVEVYARFYDVASGRVEPV
jgi:carbonic anhydrase